MLCASGLAIAQDAAVTASANTVTVDGSRTTLSGNAVVVVNGVTVRADRVVINGRDVSLEGNVQMTLPPGPAPRIARSVPVVVPRPYRVETPKIDTPMLPPWQPPARNQGNDPTRTRVRP